MINPASLHFECVRPIKEHAQLIMEWRNDPVARKMSYRTTPFTFDQFYPEFLETFFSIPDLPPFFVWYEEKPVAFIRFRNEEIMQAPEQHSIEISINIAPKERGKRLSVPILKEVTKIVAAKGYDVIIADIKQENTLSQKAFTQAGYQFFEKTIWGGQEVLRYLFQINPITKPPVFIIAEAGSNWKISNDIEENKKTAFKLIDAAKEAGADAIKFQVFHAETTYVKEAGKSDYLAESGIHTEIYSLLEQLEMPFEWIPEIANYCKKMEIEFMASIFSPQDFEQVNPYVSRHKIASYEISHPHLLRLAALSGKPLILSTGASEEEDIAWAVQEFHKHGGQSLTLLQCTAKYPADASMMHLKNITTLKNYFLVPVGLSDHSLNPFAAPIGAVSLGATVIEKHFTLSRDLPGPDHAFALTPIELNAMIRSIREIEKMLGSSVKRIRDEEKELYFFARRGIQATRAIAAGEKISEGKNMAILRPGKHRLGAHARFISQIEGMVAKHAINPGEGIQPEDGRKT